MEDESSDVDADILEKFRRLALHEADFVLAIWPPRAKMQTTLDELLLLREWRGHAPPLFVLYHEAVARIDQGRFRLMEPGGRSRYLESLDGLAFVHRSWRTLRDLDRRAVEACDQFGRRA